MAMDPLQRAARDAEAGRWEAACRRLIEVWQHTPSARIASVLEAIGPRLPVPAAMPGKTLAAREAAWVETAAGKRETDLRALLATPWPSFPRAAARRIDALGEWPAHPYISSALLALHARRQYPSNAGIRLSRRLFAALLAHRDPAIRIYLEELAAATDAVSVREKKGLAGMLRRKLPPEPVLAPAGTEALARIAALVAPPDTTQTREALFAAVYAAPLDDGPRAVLADFLIENGDLRGELISLQLQPTRTAKTEKRVRSLLREAGNQWFDGLDEDGATRIELERGFPARAHCRAIACTKPGWATIETLAAWDGGPRDLRPLTALRALYGWPTKRLAELAGHPLHTLTVMTRAGLDAAMAPRPTLLGVADRKTAAEHLELAAKLRKWPIGERVVALRLNISDGGLPLAVRLLALHPWLERVIVNDARYDPVLVEASNWTATITRDRLALAWGGEHGFGSEFRSLPELLRTLERPSFTSIEISSGSYAGNASGIRMLVQKVLATWPELASSTVF